MLYLRHYFGLGTLAILLMASLAADIQAAEKGKNLGFVRQGKNHLLFWTPDSQNGQTAVEIFQTRGKRLVRVTIKTTRLAEVHDEFLAIPDFFGKGEAGFVGYRQEGSQGFLTYRVYRFQGNRLERVKSARGVEDGIPDGRVSVDGKCLIVSSGPTEKVVHWAGKEIVEEILLPAAAEAGDKMIPFELNAKGEIFMDVHAYIGPTKIRAGEAVIFCRLDFSPISCRLECEPEGKAPPPQKLGEYKFKFDSPGRYKVHIIPGDDIQLRKHIFLEVGQ